MYWRLSESFKARLWNERRSVKELEASLIETQKRAVLVKQARAGVPTNTGAFATRVAAIARAHGRAAGSAWPRLTEKQNRYLQDARDRGAGTPEAAHRDLSGTGALRARRDLRQGRRTSKPATAAARPTRRLRTSRRAEHGGGRGDAPCRSGASHCRRAAAFGRCGARRSSKRADHQGPRGHSRSTSVPSRRTASTPTRPWRATGASST